MGSWILVGGTLMVAMHGLGDLGITGLLGAKVATYAAQHDPGLCYTLYFLTFAVDSMGDVFGSVFLIERGCWRSRVASCCGGSPRLSIVSGILLFLQGFGLGRVIGTFGLILDGIGFVLFLVFVVVSSIILLTRRSAPAVR